MQFDLGTRTRASSRRQLELRLVLLERKETQKGKEMGSLCKRPVANREEESLTVKARRVFPTTPKGLRRGNRRTSRLHKHRMLEKDVKHHLFKDIAIIVVNGATDCESVGA